MQWQIPVSALSTNIEVAFGWWHRIFFSTDDVAFDQVEGVWTSHINNIFEYKLRKLYQMNGRKVMCSSSHIPKFNGDVDYIV